MSYDPSNPEGVPPDHPEGGVPYERPDYHPYARRPAEAVRGRVQLPAVFLIIIGVLNILCAFYQFFSAVVGATMPAKDLKDAQQQISKAFAAQNANNPFANMSAEDYKTMTV